MGNFLKGHLVWLFGSIFVCFTIDNEQRKEHRAGLHVGDYGQRGLISEGKISMPSNSRTNIILSKIMRKCGIRKHITMHCGRVTCATLCLSKGMPITTIQTILGHQDIKTTRIYAHSTDGLILRDVARCWRSG